ncbi:MAG: transcription elongation factor GreA [Selenomonadaceae bacterium]|nr:transcription elongation factor GreA [Selenomonadaceae bacterium]
MADKKVMLTQEGYDKLVDKLNFLKSVRRIEVAERLKAAIALGDLSENSEYVDAKNEQGFLEGEIMDLEAQIHNSVIIHEEATDVVSLGSTVKILFPNGDEDTYMIVGSTEADPDENRISDESPIGAALLGQKAGSTVQVHAPAGVLQYKVLEIIHA